jgi:CBS domain containing-hemolysin-like protein
MSIDDLSEELGVELPDTEWDTVGGLVFNLLGHVPDEGECVGFQGLEFCTERVQGRRIVSVVISPPPARPPETSAETGGAPASLADASPPPQ